MKISVIIIQYNINKELVKVTKDCISSLMFSLYSHEHEIIVVDNNSPIQDDEIKSLADIYIQRDKNNSVAQSFNEGVAKSSGDIILHADFIEVHENKPITISIPVRATGNSVGVIAGGKLYLKRRKLKVKGMTNDLPEFLPIDITEFKIHESLKVGDLSFPKLELLDSKTAMILTIATSRVAQQTEEELEAEAAEAAEAAEGGEAGDAGKATPEAPVTE